MAKTMAMVAMTAIRKNQHFKRVNVIGLLLDYESGRVLKVFKSISDFISGKTHILEANSGTKIDVMLARINAHF